jgi:glycosyltransferase involved in cell wall biosynthesis
MKVAIVLPYPVFGAAEDYATILARGLRQAAGMDVAVLHLEGAIPLPLARTSTSAGLRLVSMPTRSMRDIRRLRGVLSSLGPDVVHVNQSYLPGMAAGALMRHVPLVVTAHNPAHEVTLSPWGRLLRRWVTPHVDAWIALSQRNAQLLATRGGPGRQGERHPAAESFEACPIHVIAPGLPTDRFDRPLSREAARRQLGLPRDAFIVGTAARLSPEKRHDLLIHAAAAAAQTLPNVIVAILGEGELKDETSRLGRELLAGGVRLLGHHSEVPRLLPAFDVFALPSDYEGLSFAMLEAMAVGLPIVATDVQGSGEALRNLEDGLLIPAGSATALRDAFLRLARNPALGQRLGAAAKRRYRAEFTSDLMIQRTVALYRDLLEH